MRAMSLNLNIFSAVNILHRYLYQFNFFFLKILFIFRERGREREREGEKHQCVVASHVPPAGDLVCNPGMCPDWGLNRQPFGSQACAQLTELHQPGLKFLLHFSTMSGF